MKERLIIFLLLMGSYLGFYLAFPLFPTIFLNSNYHFLPAQTTPAMRSILLGLTYATYYLGAFFGTPLIGKLSDRFGKRKILYLTFLAVGLMYLFSAFAIQFSSLSLLLALRFFTGFFDGCYSLAYSTLIGSDNKPNNLEFWSTIAINIGWILGSFIGWNLIAYPTISFKYLSFPLTAAATIYLLCFLLIFFYFKGPPIKKNFANSTFFSSLTSFKYASLRPILISNTSFYAATFIFTSYIPIFLMKQYQFEPAILGTVESYLCMSYCFAPFTYWLYSKYCSRSQVMCISALGAALSLSLLMLITFHGSLWLFLFMTSYFSALGFSFSAFLVTDHSPSEEHGAVLGVSQALFILIEALVSFLCGLAAALWLYLPLVAAVLCSLFSAAWIFYKLLYRPKQPSILNFSS